MFRTLAFAPLTAIVLAPAAYADAAADGDTIIVTGAKDGYRTTETTSGTKTSTPILDVPQAISVVTEEQIKDEAIMTIADLVRHIPGVTAGQGEGHRDQITLRGNNSTADFFVDGLRDDVQYFRSFYNIERVEVHKGPNAMIFGRGGGGGVLNRISKGAKAGETFGEASASLTSLGGWTAQADANIGLGTNAGLRVNAFYESLESHRDAFSGDRLGINPVIGAEYGDVRLQLGYEYVKDDRAVDRGIPSLGGKPLAGYRDMFFGVRGVNESALEAHIIRFRGEADVTDSLKANVSLLYGDFDKIYTNAYAATAINTTTNTVGIEAYRDPTTRQNFIAQANLEWKAATGGLDHLVLFGAEFTDQDTNSERITGFFDPLVTTAATRRATVAFANPLTIPTISFVAGSSGNGNRKVASRLKQSSVYVQDQISIGDHIDVVGGLRYDRFDLSVTNLFTATSLARAESLWSPRGGLVIKPVENASLYASYTKSFLPQSGDQFTTLDATTAALRPETFDNYEIGAKWDIKPDLSVTIAAYVLDRGNTRAAGATPGTIVLTGKQRSKGIETSLVGKITKDWTASLGYALSSAKIRTTTTAAPAGRSVAQVPRHQVTLWNRYDLSKRFGLGLGLYHQSRTYTSISNAVTLPAYTRIDAAAFLNVTDAIKVQVNIENLTNTRYFPVAHNDNNISTGAPLNGRLTLGVKF